MPKSLIAQVGWWLVGSLLGRLLYPRASTANPEDIAGLKFDGPTPGSPVPVGWGTPRGRGYPIWAAAPIRSGGGKKGGKGGGGGKKGQGGETYRRSFAHAVRLGPADLVQVLINDEVVWDAADPSVASNAGVDLTWHRGTQEQDVDPRWAAQQVGGGGSIDPTFVETATLNGPAPTVTLSHLPVVAGSDVVFSSIAGGTSISYFTRVESAPGQDEYTIDEETGLLTFGGAYDAIAVTIRYQQVGLTGAQEALAYPNLAYAYWHEFETGSTATLPQATYITTDNLEIQAARSVYGWTVHRVTNEFTPPDFRNRLFRMTAEGAYEELGFWGNLSGDRWYITALAFNEVTQRWYVGATKLSGGLTWTIEGAVFICPTPDPGGSYDTPDADVVKVDLPGGLTGSWSGTADAVYDLVFDGEGICYAWVWYPGTGGKAIVRIEPAGTVASLGLPPEVDEPGALVLFDDRPHYCGGTVAPRELCFGYWDDDAEEFTPITYAISGAGSITVPTHLSVAEGTLYLGAEVGSAIYRTFRWRPSDATWVIQAGLSTKLRQVVWESWNDRLLGIGQDDSLYESPDGTPTDAWTSAAAAGNDLVGIGALIDHLRRTYFLTWQTGVEFNLSRIDADNDVELVHTFADQIVSYPSRRALTPGWIEGEPMAYVATDVRPVDVVSSMMTSELFGCRIPESLLHHLSRDEVRLHNEDYDQLVSGLLETQTTGLAFAELIMAHYLGWLAVRQGRFYFGARRPETITREIVLDDMLEGGELTWGLGGERDTRNRIRVDYTDRSRLYNVFPVYDSDDPDIARNGERAENLSLLWYCTIERAQRMASLYLVVRRTPPLGMECLLGPKEFALAPGDVVAVTVRRLGLVLEPTRILSVGAPEWGDRRGGFKIAFEREPAGLLDPRTFPVQPPVTSDPPPGPLDDVGPTLLAVWEMPPELAGEDVVRTMFLVGSGHPDWSGAGLYLSFDSGATYESVGSYVGGPAAIGALEEAIPGRPAAWVDRDDVRVDLRATGEQLESVTRDAALAGGTRALLGSEIVAYRDADLRATGRYRLRGVLRGVFDGAVEVQGVGVRFAFAGAGFPTVDHPHARIGQTLYIKAASVNSFGREQDLADVVAVPFTLLGLARRQPPVFGLQLLLDGEGQASRRVIGTGALDVPVMWRYARRDVTDLVQWVDGNGSTAKHPEFDTYVIEVRTKATAGGVYGLRRTVTQTGETYTYTAAANNSDNGAYHPFVRIDVYVRRTVGAVLSRAQSLEVQIVQ